jgi:hypothetical protein
MSRIETLQSDFQPIVKELLTRTEATTGRKWAVSDALRTMAQQREIYAQGRTKPGRVVSNAKPGQSAHNFGYAVDLWPLKANGDFDWCAKVDLFKKMGAIATELGLTWGGTFRTLFDAPHVENPKWKERQAAWREGRIEIA